MKKLAVIWLMGGGLYAGTAGFNLIYGEKIVALLYGIAAGLSFTLAAISRRKMKTA